MGFIMKPSDYFRKAVQDYLKGKPRGSQKKLAEKAGLTPRHLNDFLGCRRAMTEDDQLKITDYLKVDYIDFIQQGRELLQSGCNKTLSANPPIISLEDKEHFDVTKKFRHKNRAIRINKKLVYAEQLDEDALDKIEKLIDIEVDDLEKRTGQKKRPAANENE